MQNIELSYQPLEIRDGNLTERDFTLYLTQQGLGALVKKVVIDPLEEKLKERKVEKITAGSIELSRTESIKKSTTWKSVLEGLEAFLEIRADDARAAGAGDVTKVPGVGYCIDNEAWGAYIAKQQIENTSLSPQIKIGWPKFEKDDTPVRRIELPSRDYRKVSEETVRVAITARNFVASLKWEVIEPFEETMKAWHQKESGYSGKKIPPKEESPVPHARKIGPGMYAFTQLVRVETPEYGAIVDALRAEQTQLAQGQKVEGYRTTTQQDKLFLTIKNLQERVAQLREGNVKVTTRYETIP